MTELFTFLTNVQPLGVIALLGVVIYMLVKNQQGQKRIATNHLHGLPEMAETLKRIEEKLDRNFEKLSTDVSYIRGRINGKDS